MADGAPAVGYDKPFSHTILNIKDLQGPQQYQGSTKGSTFSADSGGFQDSGSSSGDSVMGMSIYYQTESKAPSAARRRISCFHTFVCFSGGALNSSG